MDKLDILLGLQVGITFLLVFIIFSQLNQVVTIEEDPFTVLLIPSLLFCGLVVPEFLFIKEMLDWWRNEKFKNEI